MMLVAIARPAALKGNAYTADAHWRTCQLNNSNRPRHFLSPDGGGRRRRRYGRRVASLTELRRKRPLAVANVLEMLVRARLITTDAGEVEVAHEALIRRWPRLKDEWLPDNRERLRFERQLAHDAAIWREQLDEDEDARLSRSAPGTSSGTRGRRHAQATLCGQWRFSKRAANWRSAHRTRTGSPTATPTGTGAGAWPKRSVNRLKKRKWLPVSSRRRLCHAAGHWFGAAIATLVGD